MDSYQNFAESPHRTHRLTLAVGTNTVYVIEYSPLARKRLNEPMGNLQAKFSCMGIYTLFCSVDAIFADSTVVELETIDMFC